MRMPQTKRQNSECARCHRARIARRKNAVSKPSQLRPQEQYRLGCWLARDLKVSCGKTRLSRDA